MIRYSTRCLTSTFLGAEALDAVEAESQSLLSTAEKNAVECLRINPLDYCPPRHRDSTAKDTMSYMRCTGLQPHNHHIRSNKVQIVGLQKNETGGMLPLLPPIECSLREGIQLARDAGMDLVSKMSKPMGKNVSDHTHICEIRDGVSDALIAVNQEETNESPRAFREAFVISFKGSTLDFHMQCKAKQAARLLFRKRPVLLTMSKFGTADEGFPVFSRFLGFLRRECDRIQNAGHRSGPLSADYDEIKMHLYPFNARSCDVRHEVVHPTPSTLASAQRARVTEAYHELSDPLNDPTAHGLHARAAVDYLDALENGTAWTFQDKGATLSKERKMKLYGGWLPKGFKYFARRSDIDVPPPHKSRAPTVLEKWLYPPERNTTQAERGIAVLSKRGKMRVSDIHDEGETPERESTLHHLAYQAGGGDTFTLRKMKEATGVQRFWNTPGESPPRSSAHFGDGASTQEMC